MWSAQWSVPNGKFATYPIAVRKCMALWCVCSIPTATWLDLSAVVIAAADKSILCHEGWRITFESCYVLLCLFVSGYIMWCVLSAVSQCVNARLGYKQSGVTASCDSLLLAESTCKISWKLMIIRIILFFFDILIFTYSWHISISWLALWTALLWLNSNWPLLIKLTIPHINYNI